MSGPDDWITTTALAGATLTATAGAVAAFTRTSGARRLERLAAVATAVLGAGVFCYRALAVHHQWSALPSHVDGLALLVALLAAAVVYLQWSGRLPGAGLFALPLLALLALWGVCASWWTLRLFEIGSVWQAVHRVSVYAGTVGLAAAAVAGGLWLYVDRQLRGRDHMAQRFAVLGRLGNLESIEQTITRSATLGFVLLTLGLLTGWVVVLAGPTRLGEGWWHSPKVILAAVVWVIFALVMHVRLVPVFRGRRAAVLSILGFVLLLGVMGLAQMLGGKGGG